MFVEILVTAVENNSRVWYLCLCSMYWDILV